MATIGGNKLRSTRELDEWHASADASTVIDVGMPIVDTHHHLFGTPEDRNFYRMEDLQNDLDSGHRVLGTVYVEAYESGWRKTGPQALRPVGEVEMIVGLTTSPVATALGDCHVAAGVVSHADFSIGDAVEEVLQAQIEAGQGRLRGVRQRAAMVVGDLGGFNQVGRRPQLLAEPQFRRGIARLKPLGLHFEAWIYHTQLGELIELADAFPDTLIIANHIGGPLGVGEFRTRREDVMREWMASIRSLAERPNIRMKIGGMGMAVLGFGFEQRERPPTAAELASAWTPYIETCVQAFGSKRCLFESNFPVDKQSCSYRELWNAFKLIMRGVPLESRSDLFFRTACTTYRLPELERLADQWLDGYSD